MGRGTEKLIEQAFLGCLMKENDLIKDTIVQPQHLADIRHQKLFQLMKEFNLKGKEVDLLALTTVPCLDQLGGISYLKELESYAELEKFESIEELLLEAWKNREKQKIFTQASINDWDIEKTIETLEKINQLKVYDYKSIDEALVDFYEAPWEERELEKTVTSGVESLDGMTGGFKEGEVTIIAARPSMGKTDVMLHIAKNAGWSGCIPIIFSLEMPEKQLTARLIASTGKINRMRMRNLKEFLSEKQKERWPTIIEELNRTHVQIFDSPGQTIPEMRAKVRKIVNNYPDKKPIVFIDYLTLIRSSDYFNGNVHYQVSEISRNLKVMAKDFQCPVVCLAQLNRNVEARANKRPVLSDIRESGSIEQDADVILFLYRENYYEYNNEDNTLEMIVAKNRNGPIGKVTVLYNKRTGEIEERRKVIAR